MTDKHSPVVAIIDYGLGNLFSIQQACKHVGLASIITSDRKDIQNANAVILPGVGAFGDAMTTLRRLDLVEALRDIAVSDTPFWGICLGIQLLLTESQEFGRHRGLGIIEGEVVQFTNLRIREHRLKIPHTGWNTLQHCGKDWQSTPLAGLQDGMSMYFVHSFIVKPQDTACVLSTTEYGDNRFCSSLSKGSLFACQFHPERSGEQGLHIYHNLAAALATTS